MKYDVLAWLRREYVSNPTAIVSIPLRMHESGNKPLQQNEAAYSFKHTIESGRNRIVRLLGRQEGAKMKAGLLLAKTEVLLQQSENQMLVK